MTEDGRFELAGDTEAVHLAAAELFDVVKREMEPLLPTSAIMQHVGATAVPGCLTKGDLDIVIRVEGSDFARVEALIAERFSRNEGSIRTPDFASFQDAACSPPLGVQLTTKDGRFDVFHVFVEALSRDDALLARYNALKRTYVGKPMSDYRAAKDAFVGDMLHPKSCADALPDGGPS